MWVEKPKIKAKLNAEITLPVNKYMKLSHLGPVFLHLLFLKGMILPKWLRITFLQLLQQMTTNLEAYKQHE